MNQLQRMCSLNFQKAKVLMILNDGFLELCPNLKAIACRLQAAGNSAAVPTFTYCNMTHPTSTRREKREHYLLAL